jgi:hypothetical protein
VGAAAAPVGDREDLVGGEHPEAEQRDRDPDGDGDQRVGGGVGAQRDPAQRGQGDQRTRDQLAQGAPATLRDQRVQDPDEHQRDDGDLQGRQRPAPPAGTDRDPKRARAVGGRPEQVLGQVGRHLRGDQEHDQVAEPPQRQQRQQQPDAQHLERPP